MVQNLYTFTQDAMKLAATGRVEDLAVWTSADYNIKYLELVKTIRPMVCKTMGVVDLSKVTCVEKPLPAAAAAAPASKRRSEGMSRCYACPYFLFFIYFAGVLFITSVLLLLLHCTKAPHACMT